VATVDLAAVTLYFERAGEGERLLFISGTGGDLRNKPSMVFDGPLAKQFAVLGYDQRGLGQSSIPEGPYTMADYADDAAGLLEAVGWESCLVLGVSFGGMVAQEVAIRNPDQVRRLVLACTSSGGGGGASYPLQELAKLSAQMRVERQIELMDTRWNAERRSANAAEWQRMVDLLGSYLQTRDTTSERSSGAALQLEARSHHDTWDRLSRITCPTLVCGGRFDGIAPQENSERLAERIPGAELAIFDGGHQFLWQDRAAFARIISFLHAHSPAEGK
jgi:3-oxoadipate enol-lactonase